MSANHSANIHSRSRRFANVHFTYETMNLREADNETRVRFPSPALL
jgi:hypothetical protein